MALTKGQIESFSLICFNQITKNRLGYVAKVLKGLHDFERDKCFYSINGMIGIIWLYDPSIPTNCLNVEQIQIIMNKLNFELSLNVCMEELPETYLNALRDFKAFDFNTNDFA